jgi:hypothetical protein
MGTARLSRRVRPLPNGDRPPVITEAACLTAPLIDGAACGGAHASDEGTREEPDDEFQRPADLDTRGPAPS